MAVQSGTSAPYVFLSYSSSDSERALALADRLEERGLGVWLDRQAIAGGASWSAAIADGVRDCTVFAVLCSQSAMDSENVRRELQLAMEERKPLLPLLLEPVQQPATVRYILAGCQWIDLGDRPEAAWLPEVLRALMGFGLALPPVHASANHLAGPAGELRGSLPVALTSFIGRERELAALEQLLEHTRLLTLTGPGGAGKTRLALAAAEHLRRRYSDGVWFVDLSALTDAALVPAATAHVFDVHPEAGRAPSDALLTYLRGQQLLLILDNFEHVLAAASFVQALLSGCPGVCLLVTSRAVLHVPGEQELALGPLLPPNPTSAPDTLGDNAAVALFVVRAQAVAAGFRLSPTTAPVVGEIVRRLDGLPLAIELAAARIRVLSPQALLSRLDQQLSLLTGGQGRPERQQTLRATIRWSYDLLGEQERALFRRLAVFVGGWTLEAAEAVAGGDDLSLSPLDGVALLVEQSLVMRQEDADGELRFTLLQTVREFALEELARTSEQEVVHRRHLAFCLRLARSGAQGVRGHDRRLWVARLQLEQDNLRAALGWSTTRGPAPDALQLAEALFWFWRTRGYEREGCAWLDRALATPGADAATADRAAALRALARLRYVLGDSGGARQGFDESIALFSRLGDRPGMAVSLAWRGMLRPHPEGNVGAWADAEAALAAGTFQDDPWSRADVLHSVGHAALGTGRHTEAERCFQESAALFQAVRDDWTRSALLMDLGVIAAARGDVAAAQALHEESRATMLAAGVGGHYFRNNGVHLGLLAVRIGQTERARQVFEEVVRQTCKEGLPGAGVAALHGLAIVHAQLGDGERAARLIGALAGVQDEMAVRTEDDDPALRRLAAETTRAALGETAFTTVRAEGERLSLDDAIELALARPIGA